jgi:hypothetical protein
LRAVSKACETARSIVIMASGSSPSAADAATLRVVIALKTFSQLSGHVVVEVLDKEMEYLMKIVGGANVETLVTVETLARMSLSAVKQPGIAVAYEQILGFDGDEFYTAKVSSAVLSSFQFVTCSFVFKMCVFFFLFFCRYAASFQSKLCIRPSSGPSSRGSRSALVWSTSPWRLRLGL